MNELKRNSYIVTEKRYMEKKNYMVSVKAALDNACSIEKVEDGGYRRTISKSDFKSMLKDFLKLSRRKVDAVVGTFEELGIIIPVDDSEYEVSQYNSYLLLEPKTVKFCLDNLSELAFKVYCYLRSKYLAHVEMGFAQHFRFSISGKGGLLEVCGYASNGRNKDKMRECLKVLEKLKLIEISEPFPAKGAEDNYIGWYRYLYRVNDRSNVTREIEEERRKGIEESAPKVKLFGKWREYRKAYVEADEKVDYESMPIFQDSENANAVMWALERGDIDEEHAGFARRWVGDKSIIPCDA